MGMLSGNRTALYAAGIGASFAIIGCISFPGSKPAPPGLLDPRLQTKGDPAPDLRIRGDQVAQQGKDIPTVPIPPVPRGGPDTIQKPGKPSAGGQIQSVGATVPPGPPAIPMPLPPPPGSATAEAGPDAPKGDAVKRLQQEAVQAYAGMDSYIARLTRREVVGGKPKPQEVILFKFRKQPWSVYFKWLENEGKGREVVYVKGAYENKIHTLLADGDMPALLMPPDRRMALAVDSLLVRSASRHSITEAGVGHCIESLGRIIEAAERGDKKLGTVADLGVQKRQEYPRPLAMIEHTIPPGLESELPRGGKRLYGFDPDNHLPVLVVTRDDKGQEVEYYRYDRLQISVRLDDDDFNPDKLWPVKP